MSDIKALLICVHSSWFNPDNPDSPPLLLVVSSASTQALDGDGHSKFSGVPAVLRAGPDGF